MDRDQPDPIDHSEICRSPSGARSGLLMDQVRSDLRNMRSTGSMNQIHPDHLDLEKKFPNVFCLKFHKIDLNKVVRTIILIFISIYQLK